MGFYSLFKAAAQVISKIERSITEPPVLSKIIEAEGGTIDKYNRVGLFLKSRFSYFREESIYYEFRVRYGSKLQSGWRSGSWFIATSKEYPSGEWFWRDDYRRGDLPVNRPNAAVDNEIKALGYLAGYSLIGVIILIVIGIVYCCVT